MSASLGAAVTAGRLQFDGAQKQAARRLDALRDALLAPPAGLLDRLRSGMPWLAGEAQRPAPRGVYIWGGVGRGKTLLMDSFFATLESGRRSHFYRFMREIHGELATIKQHARPLDIVADRLMTRGRVICLDEFFVSDIGDAMILAGLFDALFRRGMTLVATSNLPPEELYKDGLQRQRFLPAIALIRAHVDVLHLDGGIDYRLRRLEAAPTYMDGNLPDTPAALAELFTALTGAGAAGPATLDIDGRPLRAVNVASGTAWFEFAELCEGPRSQNDYIELARAYHTLFIANIPVFGRAHEDAARRFIMLIDELYDRGVNIVVSAAARPDSLYRGERLGFEFERAASRLIEMQTQYYLAGRHRA